MRIGTELAWITSQTSQHMPASTIATYHAHTQINNHSDPNQPRKREHDPAHLNQRHHAEADSVLALDASLLQKDLGATTKHMPAGHGTLNPNLEWGWPSFESKRGMTGIISMIRR